MDIVNLRKCIYVRQNVIVTDSDTVYKYFHGAVQCTCVATALIESFNKVHKWLEFTVEMYLSQHFCFRSYLTLNIWTSCNPASNLRGKCACIWLGTTFPFLFFAHYYFGILYHIVALAQ